MKNLFKISATAVSFLALTVATNSVNADTNSLTHFSLDALEENARKLRTKFDLLNGQYLRAGSAQDISRALELMERMKVIGAEYFKFVDELKIRHANPREEENLNEIVIPEKTDSPASYYLVSNLMAYNETCDFTSKTVNICYSSDKILISSFSGAVHKLNVTSAYNINDMFTVSAEGGYNRLQASIGNYDLLHVNFALQHFVAWQHSLTYNFGINGSPTGLLPFVSLIGGVTYDTSAFTDHYLNIINVGSSVDLGVSFDKRHVNLLWDLMGYWSIKKSFFVHPKVVLTPAFLFTGGLSGYRAFKATNNTDTTDDYVFTSGFLTQNIKLNIDIYNFCQVQVFLRGKQILEGASIGGGLSVKFSY